MLEANQSYKTFGDNFQLSLQFDNTTLKILLKGSEKQFRFIMNNFNIPSQISNNFGNIQTLFEVLKQNQNYAVDSEEGLIKLKLVFQINKKKIEKLVNLKLEEFQEASENPIESVQVQKLVKKNEENIEKLKKQNKEIRKILERQTIRLEYLEKQFQRHEQEKQKQNLQKIEIGGKVEVIEQKFAGIMDNIEKQKQKQRQDLFASKFIQQFKVQGRNIRYIGKSKFSTAIYLNKIIDKSSIEQFIIKISQTKSKLIYFGIVMKSKVIKVRNPWQIYQSVGYWGDDGRVFDGQPNFVMGRGFSQGNTINMIVDFQKSTVRWSVEGRIIAQLQSSLYMKKYKGSQFVPFIQIESKNDAVQWIQ